MKTIIHYSLEIKVHENHTYHEHYSYLSSLKIYT